jgi:hypothetical protein
LLEETSAVTVLDEALMVSLRRQRWHARREELLWQLMVLLLWETI